MSESVSINNYSISLSKDEISEEFIFDSDDFLLSNSSSDDKDERIRRRFTLFAEGDLLRDS